MMLPHNTLSVVLLIVVTATHQTTGVQIDSVGLRGVLPFAEGGFPAHIKFNLTMEPEEKLQSVVWQKDDGKSRYEWKANGTVSVSGIFLGTTITSAENGELIFIKAKLSCAGNYTLTVHTSNGTDTALYELIVFDYSTFSFPLLDPVNCSWPVKLMFGQVAPYPNISCLFEDGINASTSVPLEEIAKVEPNITDHGNGTFNYELALNIPIKEIPMESSMSWWLWVEDFRKLLFKINTPLTAQPCPEPEQIENLTYFFFYERKSCYGGYLPYVLVHYSCINNTIWEPRKTLQCGSNGSWIEFDTTIPWPTCKTPQPDNIDTTPQPDNINTTSQDNNDNSGTALTFHRILLTATFLIASYSVVK